MNGTEPTAPVVGPLSRVDLYNLAWLCDAQTKRILISDDERRQFYDLAWKLRFLIDQSTQLKNTEIGN